MEPFLFHGVYYNGTDYRLFHEVHTNMRVSFFSRDLRLHEIIFIIIIIVFQNSIINRKIS